VAGTSTIALPPLDLVSAADLEIHVERLAAPWDPETAEETPAEVAVQVHIKDWSDPLLLERLQIVVCGAIAPQEEAWDVAPASVGLRLCATLSEARLRQICASDELPLPDPPSENDEVRIAPVQSRHYAHKSLIANASIEGTAVRGLCGLWFVPRQDHAGMETCRVCAETMAAKRTAEARRAAERLD